MLRDFDFALRLTHKETGISVEWRGFKGEQPIFKIRKKLRKVLAAKVAAFKRGERIDLRDFVVEENDLESLGVAL